MMTKYYQLHKMEIKNKITTNNYDSGHSNIPSNNNNHIDSGSKATLSSV